MNTVSESVVNVTENAAEHLKQMLTREPANTGKHLRLYVEGGGCSGLQYGMVFDDNRDGDLADEQHGLGLLVDPASAEHLRGAVVDYQDTLIGGGFRINNPKAQHSCGCGKSFSCS